MFPFHLHFFGKYFYFFEGIYFLLAIGTAFILSRKKAIRSGINQEDFSNAFMYALFSGILGAKIFQKLFYTPFTDFESILSVFYIWKSGLSITGAVILGPIFTYLFCKWQKLNYWKIFAIVAPYVLLAQSLGRIGCFMNGDAHGVETTSIFGMQFPKYGTLLPQGELITDNSHYGDAWQYSFDKGLITETSEVSAKVHPTQLYEFGLDLAFVFVLLWLLNFSIKNKLDLRLVPLAYVFGYSCIRFFIEFFRADRFIETKSSISTMQLTLILIALSSLVSMYYFYMKPKITA